MKTTDPFDLLLDLERRTLKDSVGMPTLDHAQQEWVAAMSDVKEILDLPSYTQVPGVKSWIVGVANVRGSLLPIMDMKGYLLGDDIKNRNKGRVIVIDYKGFNTGLVVEEVYGMRHFREGEETNEIPEVPESISPYIRSAFKQDKEHWPVFSFNEMTRDERFAHASI